MIRAMLRADIDEDLDAFVKRVAVLREHFLCNHNADLSVLRTIIRDSWRRCQTLAVDANLNLARFAVLNELQLHWLREQNAPLLDSARPVIAQLKATLGSAGYVIAMSDAEGTLLEVTGDDACRRRLARKGLLPGSNWSEASAGTNAIGVALATKRVVQLVGAEHYCAGWQDVTCTAAPVCHPDDGRLVGVIDITSNYRQARPLLTGVMAAAAADVQRRYRLEQVKKPVQSRFFQGWSPPLQQMPAAHQLHDPLARLALAVHRISAAADPAQTPLAIAEHMGWLLDAAGVALVEDAFAEEPAASFWVHPGKESDQTMAALHAAACDPTILAHRRHPAPFIDLAPLRPRSLQAIGGALAGFPFLTGGGIALVLRLPATPWSYSDQHMGATLVAHGAAMVRHARLYANLQAYAAQTEVLNQLAWLLSTLLDPMLQLEAIVRHILALTRLDCGLIALKDADRLAVHSTAAPAVDEAQIATLVETVTSIARPLWICRQHAASPEARLLPWTDYCDVVALPVPLIASSAGALIVGSCAHRPISGDDLNVLMMIARQLGLALSNARLRQAANETEALREADRLKSAFLASVSHDLRSPLTAIRASVEDLLERHSESSASDHHALLWNIAHETARLSHFVDQLLDLSRIEAGALPLDCEWVEIDALIHDVAASFRQRFAGCALEALVSPALPLAYLDPNLIAQVIWNLLENACKYGPAEGPVAIEARATPTHLIISVSDRGPGIPPAERERIFDRFYRLKRDRRGQRAGSGLGLAICHGIVTAHQGRVWIEERPGGGSIFRIALPLRTAEPGEWDVEGGHI